MEFLMALLIFPVLSFIFGIIVQILIKRVYIVVGITLLCWLIATFTIFNDSFLIWVFIYSILSMIGALIVCYVKKPKN